MQRDVRRTLLSRLMEPEFWRKVIVVIMHGRPHTPSVTTAVHARRLKRQTMRAG
jgi:hypothetical protein